MQYKHINVDICSLTIIYLNNCSYKILRAIVFWWQLRVIDISEIHLRFYYNLSKKLASNMALEITVLQS